MKQFLRYQISGSVFVFWVLVFYYGMDDSNLLIALRPVIKHAEKYIIQGIAIAMPIGVIIHQLSVIIKNWFVSVWFATELSDFPNKDMIDKLSEKNNKMKVQYILERISNLNSFYYVRFDNGILAPLLALLFTYLLQGKCKFEIFKYTFLIGFITSIYISRIVKEMKVYMELIRNQK